MYFPIDPKLVSEDVLRHVFDEVVTKVNDFLDTIDPEDFEYLGFSFEDVAALKQRFKDIYLSPLAEGTTTADRLEDIVKFLDGLDADELFDEGWRLDLGYLEY